MDKCFSDFSLAEPLDLFYGCSDLTVNLTLINHYVYT
jgi:hypothetical protein